MDALLITYMLDHRNNNRFPLVQSLYSFFHWGMIRSLFKPEEFFREDYRELAALLQTIP